MGELFKEEQQAETIINAGSGPEITLNYNNNNNKTSGQAKTFGSLNLNH